MSSSWVGASALRRGAVFRSCPPDRAPARPSSFTSLHTTPRHSAATTAASRVLNTFEGNDGACCRGRRVTGAVK